MRFFVLFLCVLLIASCKTRNRVPLTPLNSCLQEVRNDYRSCILMSYGGTTSLGSPVIQPRQQICKDRKYKYEDRCYKRFNY